MITWKSLVATVVVLPCASVHGQVDLGLGLVAHYPFTGDAADSSGNGNNGTVYNATLTIGADGTPASAYYFDGASAYIEVPNSAVLNPAVYTISAVVRPMGFYSGYCQGNVIFYKGNDIVPSGASVFRSCP